MSNIWDSFTIWAPSKSLGHFSDSTLQPSLSFRLRLGLLQGCGCSWTSSHGTDVFKCGVLYCNWAVLLLIFSSWCQTSMFLHDPFSSGASTATLAAPSQVASLGLSQDQASAALYDPFVPSEPVLGCLWTQLVVCADSEKRLPTRFHLNDADLFLITANFSAPTNQQQLSQWTKIFL